MTSNHIGCQAVSQQVAAMESFSWWLILKPVWGERAHKVLRTGWDKALCKGWNSVLTVGGETTESGKHLITQAPSLMKYGHVRHLLLWTLNYPWSRLDVRSPACVSKDIFYGFPLHFSTWELNLEILHSTCDLYWVCGQINDRLFLASRSSVGFTTAPSYCNSVSKQWGLALWLILIFPESHWVNAAVCYETVLPLLMSKLWQVLATQTEDKKWKESHLGAWTV